MMKKLLKKGNGENGWSWRKIGLLLLVPLTMFVVTTAYGRYSWMRDQCYKVATNEKSLMQTKENLLAKDIELKALIDKNNGILHMRANKEQGKREAKDDQLMGLIIEMLKQQQKSVQLQQEKVEKQEELLMEQRTQSR